MSTGAQDNSPITYADAGVDIDAGEALVDAIKPLAKSTTRPGADAGLGGFGAFFDPKAAGFKDPLIVACTDGVGTKLKIAFAAGKHDTIGIDLVAMCVNDLVVQGAEPLFFLDYYATGKLDVATARDVIAGIAEGCKQAGCALIGGETAEMPGVYQGGDYDLAGFSVGAVERDQVITGAQVKPGDVLIGLASDGVHSNGYSLVRRLVEKSGLGYQDACPFADDRSLADALLTPTRIYVKSCLAAIKTGKVKALAHITGGGILDNIPRVLPQGAAAYLDAAKWTLPPVFSWLANMGKLPPRELLRTFNCGIGMVLVTDAADAAEISQILATAGETVHLLGEIRPGDGAEEPYVEVEAREPLWIYDTAWTART